MEKYKAVIIGAGSIGALKDSKYDHPNGENILTHAHACYVHPRIDLIGIIDNNLGAAHDASTKWSTSYANGLSVLKTLKPDIIIVATPTETHYTVLNKLINFHKPKIVIAEKPFCNTLEEAQRIVDYYSHYHANIPIAINYTRRYETYHRMVKEWMDKDKFGKCFHTKITYTRGLAREACHAVDLMNHWFGPFLLAEFGVDKDGNPDGLEDYSKTDLTYAVTMVYEKCPHVFLCPVDGRFYSIFEIDMLFEKARVRFVDHGTKMELYEPIPEPVYGDYLTMPNEPRVYKTDLKKALLGLMDNVVGWLDGEEDLICTGNDAIKVHEVYDYLGV